MSQVKVILGEDVPNLGNAGDVVNVRPGYARNFLLPRGVAMLATTSNLKELEHQKRVVAERLARDLAALESVRDQVQAQVLEVTAQVGEEGKLFGSVTSIQIAELLKEKGFDVDRRKILLPDPIKEAGEHRVSVRLHREMLAEVRVVVSAAEPATPSAPEAEPEVD